MRTIKFRSYDPIKKEIWYPETIGRGYDTPNLMQFTGLLDRLGKEIYEGDIVRIPDDYEEYGFLSGEKREVYFASGGFRLKPKNTSRDAGHWCDEEMCNCEIIGNIYSDPHLLNE